LELCDGMSWKLVSQNCKRTTYLLRVEREQDLVRHAHKMEERVTVLMGEMMDRDTGKIYEQDETWVIPKEEMHSAHFSRGIYQGEFRPKLERADEH